MMVPIQRGKLARRIERKTKISCNIRRMTPGRVLGTGVMGIFSGVGVVAQHTIRVIILARKITATI